MRAIVLSEFGGPENLVLEEVPAPTPAAGEVVVEVVAAALNRRDWWMRRGAAPVDCLPAVLGSDAAGRITELGDGVEGLAVGDSVVVNPSLYWGEREDRPGSEFQILGVPRQGTYAERVCVPAENVAAKPARLGWEEAAALPLAALTAWRALVTHGEVERGTRVLIPGAGSGLSTMAIAIASALGAETYVTSSTESKIEHAVALGAVAGFDYGDPGWPDRLLEASGGIDVVIDGVGRPTWTGALSVLADVGRLINFGDLGGDIGEVDVPRLYFGHLRVQGTTMGSPREFDALLRHVERERWRPVIDSVYPLARAADAHRQLESAGRRGKVVLRVSGEAEV